MAEKKFLTERVQRAVPGAIGMCVWINVEHGWVVPTVSDDAAPIVQRMAAEHGISEGEFLAVACAKVVETAPPGTHFCEAPVAMCVGAQRELVVVIGHQKLEFAARACTLDEWLKTAEPVGEG